MGIKVLMIGLYPTEPGVVRGGVEAATGALVAALAERDDIDSVTVLRFHQGEASVEYRRESPKVEVYYVRAQYRWRMLTGSLLDLRKAHSLIAKLKPDVVHAQEIGVDGDIGTRCSANCVVTVHGITYVECRPTGRASIRDRVRGRLIYSIARRVLGRAKVVISISKYDAEEVAGLIGGSQVIIENPIAAEFFVSTQPSSTEPLLLCAGVCSARKNQLGLLNAFAEARREFPAARLALIGPQPDQTYAQLVRDRVKDLGLSDAVEIKDLVDSDRLRKEIAGARAVVLFSRQETAPTIIAQAMAAGKPVVASRVGGVAEMIDDGATGFVVEPEDEKALANRLLTLLEDEELSMQMGWRGHRIAHARFNPSRVAEKTVTAYQLAMN